MGAKFSVLPRGAGAAAIASSLSDEAADSIDTRRASTLR